ncbi:MAG: alanine racemase [Acidimicrobiales bacterium]|nr:MAG: alanine racemase [Acidimicrobiales bacterium]
MAQTEAVIDLAAIRSNTAHLRANTSAEVMAVVKANGYGHGAVQAATAALAGGASWLGVCTIDEALQLRRAGITAPILAWLYSPGQPWEQALAARIDLSVSSVELLTQVLVAARQTGNAARVHLKADTGLSRGGASVRQWPDLVTAAAKAQAEGAIEVIGIWSHFACSDELGHPSIAAQLQVFDQALALAGQQDVQPQLRHIACSGATLTLPAAHYDLIRPGIALYGYSPIPHTYRSYGLRPAMTLQAEVMLVKDAPVGAGVSYGHHYTTARATTLAVIPLGYADGVPRHASNCGPVQLGGRRMSIAGTVCMDQFVVDLGESATTVAAGDRAVLFGPGDDGEPSADDWAELVGTISYELLVRVGARVQRVYRGGGV